MRLRWIAALCCMAMLLAATASAANYPKKEVFFEAMESGAIEELAKEYSFAAVTFETTYQAQLIDEFYAKYSAGQPAQLVVSLDGYATYSQVYTINYAGGGTAYTYHLCTPYDCYDAPQPLEKIVLTDYDMQLFKKADDEFPKEWINKSGVVNFCSKSAYPGHEKEAEAGRKALYDIVKPLVEQYRSGVTPKGLPELPKDAVFPDLKSPDALNVTFHFDEKNKPDAEVKIRYLEGRGLHLVFDRDKSGNWQMGNEFGMSISN